MFWQVNNGTLFIDKEFSGIEQEYLSCYGSHFHPDGCTVNVRWVGNYIVVAYHFKELAFFPVVGMGFLDDKNRLAGHELSPFFQRSESFSYHINQFCGYSG